MDEIGERPAAAWRSRQVRVPRWRRDPRWPGHLSWRSDLALPIVIGVIQLAGAFASTWHHQHFNQAHLDAVDWILLAAGPLALTARRYHPVAVLWVAFAVTLAPSGSWFANLSLVVAFLVAATGGHRRAAWLVIVVGYVTTIWLGPLAEGKSAASAGLAFGLFAWLAVLVIAAEAVRLRRERTAQARAAGELDARRRVSEERLRMARDLHDVIGHTVSLINVQAGVGLDLMDSQPDQARAALAAIKTVSKEALDELRAMLLAVRAAGEDAPRSPAPGLDRLPEIVSSTQAAGLAVETEVIGSQRALPAAADMAAFRIIQESLTNVARHAGPVPVTVRLTYEPDSLLVEVTDAGGRADSASGARAAAGRAGRDVQAPGPGAGTGIAGMRERAAALGGQLAAGPRPGGGFAVRARLPTGEQA